MPLFGNPASVPDWIFCTALPNDDTGNPQERTRQVLEWPLSGSTCNGYDHLLDNVAKKGLVCTVL
jgi:hypothetical protein